VWVVLVLPVVFVVMLVLLSLLFGVASPNGAQAGERHVTAGVSRASYTEPGGRERPIRGFEDMPTPEPAGAGLLPSDGGDTEEQRKAGLDHENVFPAVPAPQRGPHSAPRGASKGPCTPVRRAAGRR